MALLVLLAFAILDFIANATQNDQRIQESVLKGQLAEFLLATREPDGSSLLENPNEFTKARRQSQVVSLRRPFFNYFLNKGNVRGFRTDDIRWEPPRACVLEFPSDRVAGKEPHQFYSIQACFSAVPSDPAGRYVYFALRYPSDAIRRHQRGRPTNESDRIVLRFLGQREVKLRIAFESPPLVSARQVVQPKRFDGLHELTGFLSDEGGKATRYLNGQAFERRGEGPLESGQNFVTVLGRIDASMLPGADDGTGEWPTRAIKSLAIGVEIQPSHNGGSGDVKQFGFAPGAQGTALVSLEQAYLTTIPSRASLEVSVGSNSLTPKVIWRSADAEFALAPRRTGWVQRVSDRLASFLVNKGPPVKAREQQTVAGLPPISAVLTAEPILIPDIAARAFAWLITVLLVIVVLYAILWGAFWRLDRLTRSARAIRGAHRADRLTEYANSTDQIGRLGRVLHVLLKSDNARIARYMKRLQREENLHIETMRHEAEQLKSRQVILDGIGHEIRSPLQSLLNSVPENSDHYSKLERMRRAIEALYEATKIEDGLKKGTIVLSTLDIAEYLSRFASNLREEGKPVELIGPAEGISATFDPIALEQILDHLIDNAMRYREAESYVELRLHAGGSGVAIEVFNRGQPIPEDRLEQIFHLGVTDQSAPEHKGQGLFVARISALAMRATLGVENRASGVAFIVILPPASSV